MLAAVIAAAISPAAVIFVSFLVFLWAVAGLISPKRVLLPNRMSSVGVWALSFAVLMLGAALLPTPEYERSDEPVTTTPIQREPANPAVVNAAAWSDGDWPLTIDGGVLSCMPQSFDAVFLTDDSGRMWPLNGSAMSHGSRWGAEPTLDPIWRANPALPGTRISISPLADRARSLC